MSIATTKKKKQPKKISQNYLRNSGLFYLQRYAASSHQFQTAMVRKIDRSLYVHKAPDKDECLKWLDEITQEFKELGYLNDEAYLKGMLQSLRLSRGCSAKMIIMKMRQKGFTETEISNALSEIDGNDVDDQQKDAELQAALTFARRKKLGPYHPTPARKTDEQQLATLARAGFSYEIGRRIIFEYQDDNYA